MGESIISNCILRRRSCVGVSENTSKRFYDILFGSDVNDFDILESM
jgi:hypothetical protein